MIRSCLNIICFLFIFLLPSCNKNNRTESIPTAPVSLTIDLNLPSNLQLNTVGSFAFFQGGVNGVLVIHDFDGEWYAFERTCAYQPLNSCSILWVDSQALSLRCGNYSNATFITCCDSKYQFNGFPSHGPANRRLAQYHIQKNGNLLLVYN